MGFHTIFPPITAEIRSVRAEGSALSALFSGPRSNLDFAIYAHIHHPTMRYVDLSMPIQTADAFDYAKADERLVLNLGSVGLPLTNQLIGIKSGALSIFIGSD